MSIVLANLGRADAGYEQGEGDEAASEPAQSDPQGCTKTESENADGSGRQIKQAREEITPKPRCPRKTSPAAQEKGDLSHSKREDA